MPSMQLCIENLDQAGGCTYNYSCAYTDSISWASPNEPLPMIRDPRVAFDMLFGAGSTPRSARRAGQTRRSILDWIAGDVEGVRRELGAVDRARLDRYLDERPRDRAPHPDGRGAATRSGETTRELPDAPAGVPDSFSEHMKLMFDLQVLAFETDMTRVISFKTRPRRAEPRVPGERLGQAVPPGVASRGQARERSWTSTRSASTT